MDTLGTTHSLDNFAFNDASNDDGQDNSSGVAVLNGRAPAVATHAIRAVAAVDSATTAAPRTTRAPIHDRFFVQPGGNRTPGYLFIKRALDVVGSVALLILLSPIMVVALAVLSITTRGKPFFRQERIGCCGRRFWMYKFRTMRLDADRLQHLVKNEKDGPIFKNRNDPRVTRFGRFLRSFSIDEMPQLANVLRGEMSLVGPRPLPTHEALKCQPIERRRFSVKPGLTCLWQVSGRSEVAFEDLIRMDLWYLRNQSVLTDIKLLLRTPMCVLSRRGAY
jgi:lipopolysaccharide/colanic/teichoic acid biosynthesis glycosyltransferase